jgi:hypothetical protein
MSRGKVGILLLDFHFSMAVVSRGCGNVEIAGSDFQWAGGRPGETWFWFSSPSTARHFRSLFRHAVFLWVKPANSLALACCILFAAPVSLCIPATRSSCSMVRSSFR